MKKLVREFYPQKAAVGGALVLLGLFMPLLVPASIFRVLDGVYAAAATGQKSWLMIAALRLVLLNTVRSLPHYLGAFLLIQSIRMEKPLHRHLKNILLTAVTVLPVYWLIEVLYGIHYDFAVPALLMLLTVLMVNRMDLSRVSIVKKTLLLSMLILAVQILDVLPGLPDSFFGGGELSEAIRELSLLMDADRLLLSFGLGSMGLLGIFGAVLALQIRLEDTLRAARQTSEEEHQRLMETRLRLLDARINKEQQFLVHDLKAPLTSLQIWADLLRMHAAEQEDDRSLDYLDHVDGSVSHMNLLITEIMSTHAHSSFTVDSILKLFSSQTSPAAYSSMLSVESTCGDKTLELNRTNFVRALINITDNSAKSIHHNHGQISLNVSAEDDLVRFTVTDNGEGIPEELLGKIWEEGVSGRNSSGIGLAFVKSVVTEIGGTVEISSTPSTGTTVTLSIPST